MQRLTKDQIRELPRFEGINPDNIRVVTSIEMAEQALADLKRHTCLGFDTESKPCFKKGEVSSGPHLIQIASAENAYLFPVRFTEVLFAVNAILSDTAIKKVGFGLADDRKLLRRKFGWELENADDLAVRVKRFAKTKQPVGLQGAVAMFFRQRLSKGAQRTNWAAFPLTLAQQRYAANDAFAALCIEQALANFGAVD